MRNDKSLQISLTAVSQQSLNVSQYSLGGLINPGSPRIPKPPHINHIDHIPLLSKILGHKQIIVGIFPIPMHNTNLPFLHIGSKFCIIQSYLPFSDRINIDPHNGIICILDVAAKITTITLRICRPFSERLDITLVAEVTDCGRAWRCFAIVLRMVLFLFCLHFWMSVVFMLLWCHRGPKCMCNT